MSGPAIRAAAALLALAIAAPAIAGGGLPDFMRPLPHIDGAAVPVTLGTVVITGSIPISPPRWSVAYAPETNLEALDVALIATAHARIDMAAYLLTDVAVIDALREAAARGVALRLYRDGGEADVAPALDARLGELFAMPGVQLRTKADRVLMHLKSFAVDGRVLRGGSANFSASGLKHQDNDRWETDDPATVARFERVFETMWAREGGR